MSLDPGPVEERQPANTLSGGWQADSGCWHHVQWPLDPGEMPAERRFREGIPSADRIGKLLASRLGTGLAAWTLRPGAVR